MRQHFGKRLTAFGEKNVIAAMLAFADAEAAAMRERAAGVATDAAEAARPYANGVGLGPATERHKMLEAERIAAAIRGLPIKAEH